jgi:hypothetical protein
VVGRPQLLERGWSEEEIDWRIRTGRLHRLHPGVYAVGHTVLSRQGRWMAAVFASGPEALLSHWTAAALWGIRPSSRSVVEVTIGHRSRSSKTIRRHVSTVPADERAMEDGIPVTSVHRTIFDLATVAELDAVVSMLREAEYLNRWDRLSLPDLLQRYPGKRGSRKLRSALERLREEPPGRKHSKLEERFSPFLRRHRLPLPRFNEWILIQRQALPGRLPLAGERADRRAGWLGRSSHPRRVPRGPRSRPGPQGRGLLRHPPYLEPAGR